MSDGERSFVWDPDDRPTSITHASFGTTHFLYGPEGERVRKATATRTIRYAGLFEDRVDENAVVKHVFAAGQRIATRVSSGGPDDGVYVPLSDHLGSLHALVRGGQVVLRPSYLPFGETDAARTTGAADSYQYRFTDQEQDPETELYYYGARYYDPELGRFVSPDPVAAEPYNPQTLNRYSYVLNNPVARIDPTGLASEPPDIHVCYPSCPGEGGGEGGGGGGDEPAGGYPVGGCPTVSECWESIREEAARWESDFRDIARDFDRWRRGLGREIDCHFRSCGPSPEEVAYRRYIEAYNKAGSAGFGPFVLQDSREIYGLPPRFGPDTKVLGGDFSFGAGALFGRVANAGRLAAAARRGAQLLYRYRRGYETATRLGRAAAEAEAKIGVHGVSVTMNPVTGRACGVACREAVERVFRVVKTGSDPNHFTVVLPRPVTKEVADTFNLLFRNAP